MDFGKPFKIKFKSFHLNIIWERYYLLKLAFGNDLVTFQFKTKVQVKGLTHIFCFLISFHKLYKEHVFAWTVMLKCICQLGMSKEMIDPLNGNCKVNETFFWLHSIYIFLFQPIGLPTIVWVGASFLPR